MDFIFSQNFKKKEIVSYVAFFYYWGAELTVSLDYLPEPKNCLHVSFWVVCPSLMYFYFVRVSYPLLQILQAFSHSRIYWFYVSSKVFWVLPPVPMNVPRMETRAQEQDVRLGELGRWASCGNGGHPTGVLGLCVCPDIRTRTPTQASFLRLPWTCCCPLDGPMAPEPGCP